MATKQGKSGVIEVAGQGPVTLRATKVDATSVQLQIGVDYSRAPAQLLHYDSDYCDVVQTRTGMALIFGKLKPGGDRLRTKIEISITREYFVRQIWLSSRSVHETARRLCESGLGILPRLDTLDDPDKVQCFRANMVYMAVLSSESVLDFYYISPGDIHLAQQKQKSIELEPVTRVAVSTTLLLEFLEKCRPYGEQLAAELKEEDDDDE